MPKTSSNSPATTMPGYVPKRGKRWSVQTWAMFPPMVRTSGQLRQHRRCAHSSKPIARSSSASTGRPPIRWRWLHYANPTTASSVRAWPCRNRRMRRARVLLERIYDTGRADRWGQADPAGHSRPCDQSIGHPLPESAGGDHHSAGRNGQVYSVAEIKAISATCRDLCLKLHMGRSLFRCLREPEEVLSRLRERNWRFCTFIGGPARFMFAWDAAEERVEALISDFREVCREMVPN